MSGRAVRRIAMWSGPRNISTAMMRSWENREDTAVWDEPLYAHFLARTGIDHPMREETLAAHDGDFASVTKACAEDPPPGGAAIFYQKQMSHHVLADDPLDWTDSLENCFLIRDPREMLLSYTKKRAEVTAADLGLARQMEIFERERARTGKVPVVLDSNDVLRDPAVMMRTLCAALDVPFSERMLRWPAGPRDSDGAWAPHWYDAVWASTGFAPWRPREGELTPELETIREECDGAYEALREFRLRA